MLALLFGHNFQGLFLARLSNYFSGEEGEIFQSSNTTYKERLPFNLLQTEYEQLTDPSRVFGTLLQSEL
jgi:hypothetical protein